MRVSKKTKEGKDEPEIFRGDGLEKPKSSEQIVVKESTMSIGLTVDYNISLCAERGGKAEVIC